MKVKCINNENGLYFLTVGKEYEVFKEERNCYKLQRDDGAFSFYHKSYFEIVEENKNQDITISLTKEEVNTLTVVFNYVDGSVFKSPCKHVDNILKKLNNSMSYETYDSLPERKLLMITDNCIFFNDYPEEKSPKQLKIEELQDTIEEMKKQVEQLKKEIL
jgi:hypothetical protein